MIERPCPACDGRHFEPRFERGGHAFVRCSGCGLERIDPQPRDDTLAAIYGEQYYDAWGLRLDAAMVERMKMATFRRTIAGLGKLPAGSRVLDCGAATGFLMAAAFEAGYEPYGVELSEYGGRQIAARFGADRVFVGEVERASFPTAGEGDFQAVFMCDYLEHVRDPAAVLARARELLAPSGTVVITTPSLGSLTHRLMGERWTHYKVEHLHYFNPDNLTQLLERSGFTNVVRRPAWKTMTVAYLRQQLQVYRHPVLTVVASACALLPAWLAKVGFPLLMGEMLVHAQRP
jgi:SAM-dependent methyltransferase